MKLICLDGDLKEKQNLSPESWKRLCHVVVKSMNSGARMLGCEPRATSWFPNCVTLSNLSKLSVLYSVHSMRIAVSTLQGCEDW